MTTSQPLHLANLADAAASGRRIVMVTAYDHPSAKLADEAGIDMLLVGDSAAMVVLGRARTTDVTMDEIVMFTRAVVAGAGSRIVVADMPHMSYEPSDQRAIECAGRLIGEGGAHAVKLEGAGLTIDRVRAIAASGMAPIAHLGLTPQSAARLGGFRAQARTAQAARQLLADARALQDAGAFALVLEAVPAPVATLVTERLDIPTIGIGAGSGTSGQVLVWHDLLGLTERVPRFVRRFGDLNTASLEALRGYAADVRSGEFPTDEHTYAMPHSQLAELLAESTITDAARAAAGREA